jgi:hypothetical protein
VVAEEDPVKVPSFSFIPAMNRWSAPRPAFARVVPPVSSSKQFAGAGNKVGLPSVSFHADSSLVFDAQKMINNLEAFLALGKVNAADIHNGLELALRMIA